MKNSSPKPRQLQIRVTVFDDTAALTVRGHAWTLPQLAEVVLRTTAPARSKLPLLKLARFGKTRSDRSSLRHNENLEAFSGVELDYDGEEISFDDALARLHDLGCSALLYTSPSHTEQKPRWRILMPTSREMWEVDTRRVLVRRVDGWFGGIFDKASYALSQAFYFGAVAGNPAHRVEIINGNYVDLREDLKEYDEPEPVPIPPDILALLSQDAGKGVSVAPEDNPRQVSPEQLELKITCALAAIPSDDYWTWLRIGAAIHDGIGDAGFALFEEWSQTSSKYNARECQRKWRECAKMRHIRVATIFWEADQQDSKWRDTYRVLA